MKVVALLTGRGNNTLKDKNILPVLGKPLLYYPAMAAKMCTKITDFYVSSDDDKILTIAAECGYKKIVRPKDLASPTAQHIDAIIHALETMKADGIEPDILVVLLANSGIIKKEWIEESINNLLNNPNLSASCPVLLEMDNHPYRSKCLRDDGCLGTWFNFKGKKISTNRQDLPANYVLCHNFWTLNLKNSLYSAEEGQQPWTFMGNNIKPIVVKESFDVHDEDDIKRTEKWLLEEGIDYSQINKHI
ncbi:CMP-N-acetylneuraminic acid synthetase [Bacteroides stercoris]|jgi:CMP-N-acetylneuraminic acid synthetase|uniref:acylneuraminate cytidylyltransferase family protein n=1 Tax=Bacteroides stercoris TaxID=46506 RepID=UPI000E47CA38|nr:CMP-N-acetylneuraminic acid synthetase [Bacteroides stercoris]RGT30857.1 CMP-N-acetylneuraminic acid synthetase [Bacteroides stercoris]RGZ94516.1 CMP-N-acetylneuraminic acid synthetase [Bacteroides stercoris]RHE81458.1 CMP-N-acetylneuraminic acid synthetase [Bacteroides stercoris]